jgi:two-component system sensor histidine kinase CpxA
MKTGLPLYAKILIWFFLNLLLLVLAFWIGIRALFYSGLDTLLSARAGERMQVVGDLAGSELHDAPVSEWDRVLARFSAAYKVQLILLDGAGKVLAGGSVALPETVLKRMGAVAPAVAMRPRGRGGPPWATSGNTITEAVGGMGGIGGGDGMGRQFKFFIRTDSPTRYWAGVRLPAVAAGHPEWRPITLVAVSDSMSGGGLFFDVGSWLAVAGSVVVLSALFWLPLVRGITHATSLMTKATGQMAEGHLETRVELRRNDELGRLAQSINRMAGRLETYVSGQRQFLGATAHELCSPLARMQVALGILEQRAAPEERERLMDLREDVDSMSRMVHELLSFSKASFGTAAVQLQSIPLLTAVERAVQREVPPATPVQIRIPENLAVMAEPDLLQRGLGNILRNAVRYAGSAGPVTIAAEKSAEGMSLCIADCGPGVPEEALPLLFDPFYRVEGSRSRDTGGAGLGLTIVKTCVEACGGSVSCRNRKPTGFEVLVRLAIV